MSGITKIVKKRLGCFTNKNMNTACPFQLPLFMPRICIDTHVMLQDGCNTHIYDKFPDVETLILNNCEKNFVYFNLNSTNFPNLKTIISNSHPCDWDVMHRLQTHDDYKVYLIDKYYERYYERWWDNSHPYIIPITPYEYEKMISIDYQKEDPMLLDP